jgi:hypothetical protein
MEFVLLSFVMLMLLMLAHQGLRTFRSQPVLPGGYPFVPSRAVAPPEAAPRCDAENDVSGWVSVSHEGMIVQSRTDGSDRAIEITCLTIDYTSTVWGDPADFACTAEFSEEEGGVSMQRIRIEPGTGAAWLVDRETRIDGGYDDRMC